MLSCQPTFTSLCFNPPLFSSHTTTSQFSTVPRHNNLNNTTPPCLPPFSHVHTFATTLDLIHMSSLREQIYILHSWFGEHSSLPSSLTWSTFIQIYSLSL